MSKVETLVENTLVVNVETRTVSNGTKTIWEVVTQDGTKWATFNAALGNQAIALKGQLADLRVTIEPWDGGTNYYLKKIRPAEGAATPVQTAIQAAQAAQPTPAAVVTYDQYKGLDKEKEDRRNESIHRQVAAKVAAALQPGDDNEFWSNVQVLVNFFQTGAVPGSVTSHTALHPEPTQTPLVSDDPPPLTDDDIPF